MDDTTAKEILHKSGVGISWSWAPGFSSEEDAKEFVAWLEKQDYEQRGVYPPQGGSELWSVRWRK